MDLIRFYTVFISCKVNFQVIPSVFTDIKSAEIGDFMNTRYSTIFSSILNSDLKEHIEISAYCTRGSRKFNSG
jgi:hypothetical protein